MFEVDWKDTKRHHRSTFRISERKKKVKQKWWISNDEVKIGKLQKLISQ